MGVTPVVSSMGLRTPSGSMTPEQLRAMRWNLELDERNCFISDEELDSLFPQDGYSILIPPDGYKKFQTPTRKLQSTPTPSGLAGFHFQVVNCFIKILIPSHSYSIRPNIKLRILDQGWICQW